MKFDLGKVVGAIIKGMTVVQAIKDAKGPDKLDAVIQQTPNLLDAIESGIGRDVLNDPKVIEAEGAMISAIKNFHNSVEAAKQSKGTGLPN